MERTKVTEEKRWWVKVEGNFFRMKGGKIIKKGQKFQARLDEIPEAFRDTIKPADGKPIEVQETLSQVEPLKYSIKHRNAAWYDVVNEEGKVMNEKALKKADAEELLKSLE